MSPPDKALPFPMMTVCIKLCKFVGFWHDQRNILTWKALLIIIGLSIWFVVPSAVFIYRKADTLNILLKATLELVAMFILDLRLIWHVFRQDTCRQCYHELQDAFGKFINSPHEDIRRTLKHLRVTADYFVKIYTFIVLFQMSTYGFLQFVLTIYRHSIGDDSYELTTVLETDYVFFDYLSNFWLWLPTMILSLILEYSMMLAVVSVECLYWNLLHHVSCLFKIVRMEITRLGSVQDPDAFKEKLVSLVETHEVAFKIARRLESVLSPIIGLLYCSCIFQLCYVMFLISVVFDFTLIVQMAFILQYMIFLIFTFSILATELIEESAAISQAIYANTHWYERPVSERRLLLLIQMRSDQLTVITAGKLVNLNMATFGSAMSKAYSYFTIMRRMLKD